MLSFSTDLLDFSLNDWGTKTQLTLTVENMRFEQTGYGNDQTIGLNQIGKNASEGVSIDVKYSGDCALPRIVISDKTELTFSRAEDASEASTLELYDVSNEGNGNVEPGDGGSLVFKDGSYVVSRLLSAKFIALEGCKLTSGEGFEAIITDKLTGSIAIKDSVVDLESSRSWQEAVLGGDADPQFDASFTKDNHNRLFYNLLSNANAEAVTSRVSIEGSKVTHGVAGRHIVLAGDGPALALAVGQQTKEVGQNHGIAIDAVGDGHGQGEGWSLIGVVIGKAHDAMAVLVEVSGKRAGYEDVEGLLAHGLLPQRSSELLVGDLSQKGEVVFQARNPNVACLGRGGAIVSDSGGRDARGRGYGLALRGRDIRGPHLVDRRGAVSNHELEPKRGEARKQLVESHPRGVTELEGCEGALGDSRGTCELRSRETLPLSRAPDADSRLAWNGDDGFCHGPPIMQPPVYEYTCNILQIPDNAKYCISFESVAVATCKLEGRLSVSRRQASSSASGFFSRLQVGDSPQRAANWGLSPTNRTGGRPVARASGPLRGRGKCAMLAA